jgi:hypothetical protein
MKLPLFRLIAIAIIASGQAPAAENPPSPDKLAVFVVPEKFSGVDEYRAENILNCLINQIDYRLWEKRLNFGFLSPQRGTSLKNVIRAASSDGYNKLIYIRPSGKFSTKKISDESSRKNQPREYLSLTIEMAITYSGLDSVGAKAEYFASAQTTSDWINQSDATSGGIPQICPEPYEYTIMKAVEKGLNFLPAKEKKHAGQGGDIPLSLVVDSKILNQWRLGGDAYLDEAIEYSSYLLNRQFGFGLNLCGKSYFTTPNAPLSKMGKLFETFLKSEFRKKDTLVVCVFRPDDINRYYADGGEIRLAFSDILNKTALIAELPPPDSGLSAWKAFINGRLILHEIGHLFGAIHVFDRNSIMTEDMNWISPGRFDTLNSFIIRSFLSDWKSLNSLLDYSRLLINAIETTGYKLSDYPAIFAGLINANHKEFENFEFGPPGTFGASVPNAAAGYLHYFQGKKALAEEYFTLALAADSDQAALNYYLSQVAGGETAKFYFNRANRQGLYISKWGTLCDYKD